MLATSWSRSLSLWNWQSLRKFWASSSSCDLCDQCDWYDPCDPCGFYDRASLSWSKSKTTSIRRLYP